MHSLTIRWVTSIAVLLGLCLIPAFAQSPTAGKPIANEQKKKSLFSRFNLIPAAKQQEPASSTNEKEDAMKAKLNAQEIANAKMKILLRQKEQDTFLRRQAVCDKLLAIARKTNDQKLGQMAEQLMDMAWDAYCKKTNSISGNPGRLLDHSILHSQLGAGTHSPVVGSGVKGHLAARKEQ